MGQVQGGVLGLQDFIGGQLGVELVLVLLLDRGEGGFVRFEALFQYQFTSLLFIQLLSYLHIA